MSPAKLGNPLKEHMMMRLIWKIHQFLHKFIIQLIFQFIDAKYDHTSKWLYHVICVSFKSYEKVSRYECLFI